MKYDQIKVYPEVKSRFRVWSEKQGYKFSQALNKLLDIAEKKKN